MILLLLGVVIWSGVHFIPSLGIGLRQSLIERFGVRTYKIGFALAMVASIVLMVLGWRAMDPVAVYDPPAWAPPITSLAVLAAFILFAAAHAKTNIKRFLRHPQLTGLVVWAVGHLLANGDNRSLILFGGLGLWAIAEIFVINRRDGVWQKPDSVPLTNELMTAAKGLVIFVVVIFAHPYLFGVSPLPH